MMACIYNGTDALGYLTSKTLESMQSKQSPPQKNSSAQKSAYQIVFFSPGKDTKKQRKKHPENLIVHIISSFLPSLGPASQAQPFRVARALRPHPWRTTWTLSQG